MRRRDEGTVTETALAGCSRMRGEGVVFPKAECRSVSESPGCVSFSGSLDCLGTSADVAVRGPRVLPEEPPRLKDDVTSCWWTSPPPPDYLITND